MMDHESMFKSFSFVGKIIIIIFCRVFGFRSCLLLNFENRNVFFCQNLSLRWEGAEGIRSCRSDTKREVSLDP